MISATVFVAVAVILCITAVLALFAITHVAMSGREAIERDGLVPGTLAPSWSLADSAGGMHHSPPRKPLQFIVFTDNSLQRFPSVAKGLRELADSAAEVEIVVLMRHPNELAEPILELLGLRGIPVLVGSRSLYGRYNVRVSPFVIVVDSAGRVRGSSLVNHDWQITKLHQIASLPVEIPGGRAAGRLARRTAGAGV